MSKQKATKQVPAEHACETPVGVPTDVLRRLTGKKLAFAREYLVDQNATAAYIRAGYKASSADKNASRMLADPDVQAFIASANAQAMAGCIGDLARYLRELECVGLFDPRKLLRPDGSVKPSAEWDDATAAAVASIEVTEEFDGTGDARTQTGWTKKIRAWDKVRALMKLIDHAKEAASAPPPPEPGSSADTPIHVQHTLSPDAIRSFLADLRGAGLAATGLGDLPPDGDVQPVGQERAVAPPDQRG